MSYVFSVWIFISFSPNNTILVSLGCYDKIPLIGWLKQQKFISPNMEAGSPRLRCQHGWALVRALFLACRWLPSQYVLTGPLLGTCAWTEKNLSSSFFKATNPRRLGSHHYDSFNHNYLLKALFQHATILGVIALIYEFGKDTTQSTVNTMRKILLILVYRWEN